MPYYTRLWGVFLDLAADPPQASVDTGSGRGNFACILGQSTGFEALAPADPEADALTRGAVVRLSGEAAGPLDGAVYAGAGVLQTSPAEYGITSTEAEFAVHPLPGHFLIGGDPGDPDRQEVYFVTDFALDERSVGFDLTLFLPAEQVLTDVRIADLATTPPLDQPRWAGLREALGRTGWLGTAITYDPGAIYPLAGAPPCFTPGTLIATALGPRPVEALRPGDLLCTADHGLQPLRWVGRVALSAARPRAEPGLRPVRIGAGALGRGQPARDLRVSPQHRVLVRSKVAERMLGAAEVLVAARQLVGLPGIALAEDPAGVTYYHLLLDRHELLWSNGAVTESLYTGPQALKGLSPAARREILTLFPALREAPPKAARPLVPGRKARKLAARHHRNRRPLLA